jgi:iron complex outermembrane recepter protein
MFARWPVFAVLAMGLMGQAVAAHSSDATYAFNIPAEALADTLRAIGQETTINIVFAPETVGDARAPAIQGELTAEQAVFRALSKTKLRARKATANSILIEPLPVGSNTARQGLRPGDSAPGDDPPGEEVVANSSSTGVAPLATMNSEDQPLKEVVVTAEKKEERLLDVPVPVTVLDADSLAENDQNRLQDYFAQIPGLSLTNNGGGGGLQYVAIRGVTTGVVSNPTVGIMIDDVPYGSSTAMGSGNFLVPDIDPSDLERIEVLKGPQGTLYGADSMGGLIKFVTRDPTTDAASGRVEVLGDYVDQGELGYGVRAAANVPLTDDLAIRASSFARRDPGYVDNVLTNQDNVNRVDVYGGHLSALWRPSDAFSLKLGALLQNTDGDGTEAIDATLDANGNLHPLYGYQQQARLRGTEDYQSEVRLYTATLNAKLGGLDFISITGYGDNRYLDVQDYSELYGVPSEGLYFAETQKVTQEFRLSSNQGRTLDWLAGAFFTHENSPADLPSYTVDPATGAQTGLMIDFNYPSTVTEYALFGDLTFHVTDRFDLQVGGRESENRQVYTETDTGPLVPAYFGYPSPYVDATERASGNAFTYLFTPEFRISPALMVYARVTSGYRLGGNNVDAVVYHLPTEFKPDRTTNEELGVKGGFFNGALTLDASAYYIDWKQIQITLNSPTGRYDANGGDAKSQGVEVSIQTQPAKGLTIGANASVNDARLTQNLPPTSSAFGVSGERLPYSVPFSGSVSLDQHWPLVRDWIGFMGATVSYVGGREGEFARSPAAPRLHLAAYADSSLRAGVSSDSWTINLFANNVANTRGVVGGGEDYGEAVYNVVYIQPRTIGLSLVKKF